VIVFKPVFSFMTDIECLSYVQEHALKGALKRFLAHVGFGFPVKY
jgi:hypothetical protein